MNAQSKLLLLVVLLAPALGASAQEVPSGYRQVLAADFSSTAITPTYDHQWWYLLSGVERGVDWSATKQLNGGQGYGFVLQPYMFSRDIRPFDYQDARIVAEGDNMFLRFINYKRDGDWKSRGQLLANFRNAAPPITGLYSRISFRIGADMKSKLQHTWLDLVEVHDIGGGTSDVFRQSFYIMPDRKRARFFYQLQLRNETRDKVVYRLNLADFDAWDRWETLGFQFESAAADRPALVRVWAGGKLLVEKNDTAAGYPIQNFHAAKAYVDNSTEATVPFTLDIDNWVFCVKEPPH